VNVCLSKEHCYFQAFQPALTDLAHLPASLDIGQVPHHQEQQYQFVFTGADHKPIQYPPVPSVYDPPNEGSEDRVDKRYGNHYQQNRSKRL
jgi:hypothetical protein